MTEWEGLSPPYATVVADPPWHYDKVGPDKDREGYRGGGLAYSSLSLDAKPPRCTTPVTTEFVLIGKRGKPPRMPWHGTTWFQWPHQAGHSVKPALFLDLVETWSPGPYVELFARAPRLGWDHWGRGYEVASCP